MFLAMKTVSRPFIALLLLKIQVKLKLLVNKVSTVRPILSLTLMSEQASTETAEREAEEIESLPSCDVIDLKSVSWPVIFNGTVIYAPQSRQFN